MMKTEQYQLLTEQIRALIEGETDGVAVMANVCAAIHETMGFWWTGFYRVKDGELVLGPFQGPVACMHIGYGKGVCGTAWKEQRTIVVPDVEQFPGHIACSSLSRSEIVVPVFSKDGEVMAVLDIDSKELATFDDTDRQYLEGICKLLGVGLACSRSSRTKNQQKALVFIEKWEKIWLCRVFFVYLQSKLTTLRNNGEYFIFSNAGSGCSMA